MTDLNSIFLTWEEIAETVKDMLAKVFPEREIHVSASADDYDYWDTRCTPAFTLNELDKIMLFFGEEGNKEAYPEYPDVTSKNLGMQMSEKILSLFLKKTWKDKHIAKEGIYLIGCETVANESCYDKLGIASKEDIKNLPTFEEIVDFLKKEGCDTYGYFFWPDLYECLEHFHRADSQWQYPFPSGNSEGSYFVPTRDGILVLPVEEIDDEEYEKMSIDDAHLADEEELDGMIEFMNDYNKALKEALLQMRSFIRDC